MKKVLITGITGQDGSYMLDYLLEKTDYKLYGMLRRSSNLNSINISHLIDNPRIKLVTGDLSDSQSIDNLVREIKPDYFINLAAQSFVGVSWQIPEQTFDIDAVGVIRCLEAIRKHVPNCRFYNAGSSEELGNVDYYPQNERHNLKPRSPYGAAKASARHIVKVYRESYNLYAVQGLLYNHESERRGEEFVTRKITKAVAKIKNSLDTGKDIIPLELGNLDAKRDWSHALDFIDGIWKMLNQDTPQEFILASEKTHSIREFVEQSFKCIGINGQWKFTNINKPESEIFTHTINGNNTCLVRINTKFYRPAEVDFLLGDATLAKTNLKWQPNISFTELIRRMVANDIQLLNTTN